MHMLDFKQGDKTALKAFIDKVSGLEADKDKYTVDTWAAFDKELDEANAVTDEQLENVIPVVVEEFKAARDEALSLIHI